MSSLRPRGRLRVLTLPVLLWGLPLLLFVAFQIVIPTATAQTLAPVLPIQPGAAAMQTGVPLSKFVYMQVLAHEDDDILFMNPDVANEIAAGVTSVSVYLTAGQSCGVGNCSIPPTAGAGCPIGYRPDQTPPTTCLYLGDSAPPLTLTREEFAAARQSGIRAAYAQMAGVANNWTRTLIQPDGNYTVELYTLAARPNIYLVFMNLPDGGDTIAPNTYALTSMYYDSSPNGDSYLAGVIVPFCDQNTNSVLSEQSPIPGPIGSCDPGFNVPPMPVQVYDRAGIVSVLAGLIQMYQPIEVRTLDPHPFELCENIVLGFDFFCSGVQISDGTKDYLVGSVYLVNFDNADHTAAALFLDEVLANYHGPNGAGGYSTIQYKGYSSPNFPENLGDADYDSKSATVFTYIPYDPNFVTFQDGYPPYYHRAWERYPGSTTWLERASDGRLVAANVEDRSVKTWYESVPGGPWVGPVSIWTGAPISPYITLLKRPDGLLQIFALRLPLTVPGATASLQDIVTAVQVPPRFRGIFSLLSPIAFGPWQSVGSPDANLCSQSPCQFVGVQTAAIDATGQTFIFAKNSEGFVSYTFLANGTWSAWDATSFASQVQGYFGESENLPVLQDIIDGIAAIMRDDGRIEVFATLREGNLWHFVQDAPGSAHFTFDPSLWYFSAASAPTVTKNQDGRLEIFYREAADSTTLTPGARVLTLYQSNGVWKGPVVLYGDAGTGPVAAIRRGTGGQIMLFERNVWDGISETHQVAPNSEFVLQWQILGGLLNEYPAAATDIFGRTVLVVKGLDGNLYMRREVWPSLIDTFEPWMAIGGFTFPIIQP
jgi:hypothetical protein